MNVRPALCGTSTRITLPLTPSHQAMNRMVHTKGGGIYEVPSPLVGEG